MGCSPSVSDKAAREKILPANDSNMVAIEDKHYSKTSQYDGDVHINHTHILILPRDPGQKLPCLNDGDCVVHMNDNNGKTNNSIFQNTQTLFPSTDMKGKPEQAKISHSPKGDTCMSMSQRLKSEHRDIRSNSLPGGIKSVLKTGKGDPSDHMLSNRPIKTVTFVDSVSVLTVH
ncbi:uncharacterized protein LOC128239194 isoform X2 [Mya arenaria]|uniref:uncharacterized protein LOC128239194 isoform X2 n=1 Tax=Mya arenaria TaxID=6604 RepID=UPI0022E613AD|nr:uncharacterized protein LOC128239194 isoform X2 [Mya arenaria]